MGAAASADTLRFRERPRTSVRSTGEPGVDSATRTRRTNLPSPVVPGATYRGVRVMWTLADRLRRAASRSDDHDTPRRYERAPEDPDGPAAQDEGP